MGLSMLRRQSWLAFNTGYQSLIALEFDGVNDSVDFLKHSAIDEMYAGGGTQGGWFFIHSDGGTSTGRLFDKTTYHIATIDESGGSCAIEFSHGFSTTPGTWRTTGRDATLNSWVHISVGYDNVSVSNDPVIKINNVASALTESSTPVGTASLDAANHLYLGNDSGGSVGFDGAADDIVYLGAILTAGEHTEWYGDGLPVDVRASSFAGSVITFCPFDEDTYPIIFDANNASFGAELIDAGQNDFTSALTFWSPFGSTTNVIVSEDLVVTYVDVTDGSQTSLTDGGNFASDLTVGSVYKLETRVKTSSSTSLLRLRDGAVNHEQTATTTYGILTWLFVPTDTVNPYLRVKTPTGLTVTLDYWTVKAANGNHGIMLNMSVDDFVAR